MSFDSTASLENKPASSSKEEYLTLQLTPVLARAILKCNTSPDILVMCRGYNDEADQFTELVWRDDADLEFEDQASYPEFQLWVRR